MWIEATTMGDLLDRNSSRPAKDAVAFPDRRVTYSELTEMSDRYAAGLLAMGVGPGEKVGILMPNQLEFVAALFGIAKLGAVAVPVNGRFKARELGHVLSHADVRVLFTAASQAGADYPAMLAEMFDDLAEQSPTALQLRDTPALRQIVNVGGEGPGFLTLEEFEQRADSVSTGEVRRLQQRVRIRDVALLMYTSGTTSTPKGCLLSHESLVRQGTTVARTRFLLEEEDRFWDPLPLFHCGGIVPMLGCFSVGATFFHAGHFDPDIALRTLEKEHITIAYPAFETIWLGILNHPDFDKADLSSLRCIQSIATPERLAQFEARLPTAPQVSSYGSTECATNLTLPMPDDPYQVRINTLGSPVDGMEMKAVSAETGEEVAPGAVGELCFRGYSRFDGYYKDPDLTAATIDGEGWFHTGDLGSIDESGRVTYAGRLKDMLKVGGENVSALEVEDYLSHHPAIDIVQVLAAPDDRYTEVPAAFVQLKPGAEATEGELIEFCIGQIATYKVPRYVRFVTDWPMSGTKIKKYVLREQIAEELRELGVTEAPKVEDLLAAVRAPGGAGTATAGA